MGSLLACAYLNGLALRMVWYMNCFGLALCMLLHSEWCFINGPHTFIGVEYCVIICIHSQISLMMRKNMLFMKEPWRSRMNMLKVNMRKVNMLTSNWIQVRLLSMSCISSPYMFFQCDVCVCCLQIWKRHFLTLTHFLQQETLVAVDLTED
jgi:hypothetical protein